MPILMYKMHFWIVFFCGFEQMNERKNAILHSEITFHFSHGGLSFEYGFPALFTFIPATMRGRRID